MKSLNLLTTDIRITEFIMYMCIALRMRFQFNDVASKGLIIILNILMNVENVFSTAEWNRSKLYLNYLKIFKIFHIYL